MHDSCSPPVLAPTAPGERIDALDVLRGFALLGIALVNVEFFTRPLQDINDAGIDPATRGVDYLAEWLTYFFAQGKFWTLFALLFGMGFAVMIDRAGKAGRPFVPPYLRRSLALLGIGAVHAVVIWSGDILVSYALGALVLLLARQARRAWLGRRSAATPAPMTAARLGAWGAALYGLPLVLILLVGVLQSLPGDSAPTIQEQNERSAHKAEEAAQRVRAVAAYSHGTFAEAVAQRVDDTLWQLGTLPVTMFFVLGLFLLGGAIQRSGVLSDLRRHQSLLRQVRNVGLPLGFAAMAMSTWLGTASPSDDISFSEAAQVTLFLSASLVLALAYGATVLLLLLGPARKWLQFWFAPAGRMALTNYLLQSVVGTLLFYGYGVGLWGQVGRGWQALGVLAVFTLQVALSRWWLARFRYGPTEWVWRCITYWRLVPIRS